MFTTCYVSCVTCYNYIYTYIFSRQIYGATWCVEGLLSTGPTPSSFFYYGFPYRSMEHALQLVVQLCEGNTPAVLVGDTINGHLVTEVPIILLSRLVQEDRKSSNK